MNRRFKLGRTGAIAGLVTAAVAAIARASSAVRAKPCSETGIPAFATIALDSYSKNRIGGGGAYKKGARELAPGCPRDGPQRRRPIANPEHMH